MAFTYSGDPSSSEIDWLRFSIGDTNPDQPILQDGEISYILNMYDNEVARLAVAFRQCANYYGARAAKRKLGPQSEDATNRYQYYVDMAEKYDKKLMFTGVPPLPNYSQDKIFDKDMMRNV